MIDLSAVESIFFTAQSKADSAERAAYLDAACAGDAELRRVVERLLAAQPHVGDFLAAPAVDGNATLPPRSELPAAPPTTEQVGQVIAGRYTLVQKLGEGGMGSVWVAEQTEPVKRRVALKMIRAGLGSHAILRRFDAERQALALMDHPNIAKILDGGETAAGQPFFVMELVKGVPITKYCDELHLSVRDRLKLFGPVCQAIQHAHQKGIIHRDVKPGNVLVAIHDGGPVPKVIDFGVAKAVNQRLTDQTMNTEIGAVIGTLEYMSPEQAELSILDIDTRADVYALGVLLYELLTGTTPINRAQLKDAAIFEMLRMIKQDEPPKPSTRLTESNESLASLAAQRRTEPAKLTKEVRGELDWIVMKCLEKDRTRRYESASGLAKDVARFLDDEAVEAGPPSARYRLGKLVRRHKGRIVAASLVLLALVVGVIGLTVGLIRAERARVAEAKQRAAADVEKETAKAERDAKDKALTAQTAARAQTQAALDALTEDAIEKVFPKLAKIGDDERAVLRKILGFYEEFAAGSRDTTEARFLAAEGQFRVARLRAILGEQDEAVIGYREAVRLLEGLAADFPGDTQNHEELSKCHIGLAGLLRTLGKHAEAETAYRRAIAILTKLTADFPDERGYRRQLAHSLTDLGSLLSEMGRNPDAESAYRKAVALREKINADPAAKPDDRRDLAAGYDGLGALLADMGKRPEAEASYRKALAILEKIVADWPQNSEYRQELAQSHFYLGTLLADVDNRADAEAAHRRALALREQLVADFPAVPDFRQDLGHSHNSLGYLLADDPERLAEAEAAYRQALAIREKLAAQYPAVPGHRADLAQTHKLLGRLLASLERPADAEVAYRKALATLEKLAADSATVINYRRDLANTHDGLGSLLADAGRVAEAEAAFARAAVVGEKLAADFPDVPDIRFELARSYGHYGDLLRNKKRPAEALARYDLATTQLEAIVARSASLPRDRSLLRETHSNRAECLTELQRHAEAVNAWDRVIEVVPETDRPTYRLQRAESLARAGEHAKAIAEAEAQLRGEKADSDSDTLYNCACVFALCSAGSKDIALREQHADRAMALMKKAAAAGFSDAEYLKAENDFASLRTRTDFKHLVAEMEKKTSPKQDK